MAETDNPSLDYARKRGLEDLIFFARHFLGFTKSKVQWEDEDGTKHAKEMEGAEYGISRLGPHKDMAALLESPSHYKLLCCSRDAYKTTFARCRIAQRICANPDIRILYSQRTKALAQEKIDNIAKLVNSPKVQEAYGVELVRQGDSWVAENRSPLNVDPTLAPAGVDSETTSSHWDEIWLDDPQTWMTVRNREQVEKTRDHFDLLMPLLDPTGIFVVIGTPYAHGDLLHNIKTEMEDVFEILLIDCGMVPKRDPGKRPYLEGTPRFTHMTKEYLHFKLRTMKPKNFLANYCLRIVGSEQQVFTRDQFRSRCYTQAIARGIRGWIFTDTATAENKKACLRVVAVAGLDQNDIAYLFDVRAGRWPAQMIPLHICDLLERWEGEGLRINGICLERIALNQALWASIKTELMSRSLKARPIWTPRGISQGSKDNRIEALAPRFDRGNFIVLSSVPTTYDDGGDIRTLYNPDGWSENGVPMPSGDLVDQLISFPSPNVPNDIWDALADLDVCDKDGVRLLRGAGIAPRLDVWARTTSEKEKRGQEKDIKQSINAMLHKLQSQEPQQPRSAGSRRVAGERWRHLGG